MDKFFEAPTGFKRKYIDLGDSFAERVVAVNADGTPIGSAAAADREISTTHYRVKTAFSEGAVDDVVTFTEFYDMATYSVVGAIWKNQTKSLELTVFRNLEKSNEKP